MNAKIRVKNLILFFAILLMLSGTFLSVIPKNIKASEDNTDVVTNINSEYKGLHTGYTGVLNSQEVQFMFITNSLNKNEVEYSEYNPLLNADTYYYRVNYVLLCEPFDNNGTYKFTKICFAVQQSSRYDKYNPFANQFVLRDYKDLTSLDVFKGLFNRTYGFNYTGEIDTSIDTNLWFMNYTQIKDAYFCMNNEKPLVVEPDEEIPIDYFKLIINGRLEDNLETHKTFKIKKGDNVLNPLDYGFTNIKYAELDIYKPFNVLVGSLVNVKEDTILEVNYRYKRVGFIINVKGLFEKNISSSATYYDDLSQTCNLENLFKQRVYGLCVYNYPNPSLVKLTNADRLLINRNKGIRLADLDLTNASKFGRDIVLSPVFDFCLNITDENYKEQPTIKPLEPIENIYKGCQDVSNEVTTFFKVIGIVIILLLFILIIRFIIDIFRRK